ncbi:MAG TPA: hypothetical protein VMT91_01080, partial [Anaerolineales bacterium]|nr:hypothetical protein [Anaerolineales bacterium]
MATFNKDIVQKYGSLDAFAQADGCIRIYESDDGYHTVRRPADEEAILSSPYVHNARLVWPARQASAPAPAQAARRPAAAAGPGASVPAVEKTATPPRNFKIITHVLSIFLWGFI